MARMPRLYVHGCALHIIQRGNNRAVCFYCDADYAFYLQKLKEASEKYSVKVHAFVLWEGRDKSCLVASDDYLLTVSRYIELNPVRAGMVNMPGEYPWSSYKHNAMGIKSGLICEHQIYRELGTTPSSRVMAYRALFNSGLPVSLLDEIRLCANKEWVVGRSDFIQQIESAVGRKVYHRQWGGNRRSRKEVQEL